MKDDMQKKLIFDQKQLSITIARLCQQLIENHQDFKNTVFLGLQPRGVSLAEKIVEILKKEIGMAVPMGALDITFYRDDFRRRDNPIKANTTHVPFLVENKNVVLIDDVLFTGRSVRAAMDAMSAFGRPHKVELLALIDRKYTRDLPIEAHYVGRHVDSVVSQKVLVEWAGKNNKEDKVWLITSDDKK